MGCFSPPAAPLLHSGAKSFKFTVTHVGAELRPEWESLTWLTWLTGWDGQAGKTIPCQRGFSKVETMRSNLDCLVSSLNEERWDRMSAHLRQAQGTAPYC